MKRIISICLVALFCSCEAIFVENISDKNVKVIAPVNGSEIAAGIVNFSWEKVKDADEYQLQIVSPDFTNANTIMVDTVINKTFHTKELVAGDYEWRIKAMNSEYETNYTINTLKIN